MFAVAAYLNLSCVADVSGLTVLVGREYRGVYDIVAGTNAQTD